MSNRQVVLQLLLLHANQSLENGVFVALILLILVLGI